MKKKAIYLEVFVKGVGKWESWRLNNGDGKKTKEREREMHR